MAKFNPLPQSSSDPLVDVLNLVRPAMLSRMSGVPEATIHQWRTEAVVRREKGSERAVRWALRELKAKIERVLGEEV
jgi:hypothetical protein